MPLVLEEGYVVDVDGDKKNKRKRVEIFNQMEGHTESLSWKQKTIFVSNEITIDASVTHEAAQIEKRGRKLMSSQSTDSFLGELVKASSNTEVEVKEKAQSSPCDPQGRPSKRRSVRFTDSPTSVTVYDATELVDTEGSDGSGVDNNDDDDAPVNIDTEDNLSLKKRQCALIRSLLNKFV